MRREPQRNVPRVRRVRPLVGDDRFSKYQTPVTSETTKKRADCATPAARRALARGAVVRSGARHLLDAANNTFECVRTLGEGEDALYCEFDDAERFVELYDHRTDPWQLRNLAESPAAASVRSRYAMRLRGLRGSKAAPVY